LIARRAAGWATERVPDVNVFSDERSQRISERLKKYRPDIEMSDPVYYGERSHVIEYLTSLGVGGVGADDAGSARRQWVAETGGRPSGR
jgi:hypothetical protein